MLLFQAVAYIVIAILVNKISLQFLNFCFNLVWGQVH